jgi:lauroyl/myristoyl acyltransferase
VIIEPELELIRDGRGAESIRSNTIIITQWLERTVRRHPDQWNWMNIRWSEPNPDAVNEMRTSNID